MLFDFSPTLTLLSIGNYVFCLEKRYLAGGGAAQHNGQLICFLDPASPGSISRIPKFFSEGDIVDVDEVNQHDCLEE